MSEAQKIEQELREYLEKEPNLSRSDRLSYLMAIYTKRQDLSKLNHMVTHSDLFHILSSAKRQFVTAVFPVRLTGKQLDSQEGIQVVLLEAFVMYLNKNNLLTKLVKFDFTE